MSEFGEFVKGLLAAKPLSLREFAARIGKGSGGVSQILNAKPVTSSKYGSTYRPPLDEMDAWADALGCTPDERDHLKYLAERTHCPPGILAKLDQYEADVIALRQQVATITTLARKQGLIPKG